jgi:ABC-type methionine transport system ATPase subunit
MAKRAVTLVFPQHLIKEPVIYRMAKQFEIVPNIRRAKVTETTGEVVLLLEGDEHKLEAAIAHLTSLGVSVEPVEGDIIEP